MPVPKVLGVEIVAALTAVALLAPETVAFAQIAGVPPAYGLAAAPLCVLAYAVLGRSRRLVVGATAATAVISSAAVLGLSPDPVQRMRLAAALALATGALLVVTGLLRCGFIARFLAPEALRGFLFGLAVVIVVRQVAVLVDVETRAGDVFVRAWDVVHAVPRWNLASLATGLVALLALVVLETWLPRVPATLLVLVVAAAASSALQLERHGVRHVADVPAGLPRLRLPQLSAGEWLGLVPTAAGLALIVFVLSHGVAERLRDADEAPLNADREMIASGVANLLAGMFGGLAVSGSPSASSAARVAGGGRTRWMPVLCAALLLLVALALAPAFRLLPEPALAAVVITAVRPFLALDPLRTYLVRDRRGFAVAGSAVLGVMMFTLIPGLLIAVVLSLLIFIADTSRLRVSELGRTRDGTAYLAIERFPDLVSTDGVTILRPDGQLFFANVDRLSAAVDAELARDDRAHDALVLDLAASFELRLNVIDALIDIRRRVEHRGRVLMFAHLYLDARDAIVDSPLAGVPAFPTLDAAVEARGVSAGQ
ncbi:SulP family inorganic anion transporter [Planotetraspora sp. A-T 1434]|uniref:SulP family inorganic anion transporter n=1 Tax=Planotetraspora sp. A-T 1434 TaxID=2979219 RepID=UPI0021BF5CDF|nr:SulP family inorganic anion transporter [Planotetraspora sp. A-T 1434]MCT9934473.1 SulP family inorganic anion transporter [Planotetraspora sp. A-T 1434]